jgi:RNA polymerase sigma-70 factor (ECF subfamily)
VRNVLRRSLGPDEDVEDLLQEVFIALIRGAGSVRDGAALRGYLVGVAVRQAALELRRRRIRRWITLSPTGTLPEPSRPPEDVEGRHALRALYRLLDTLAPRRRLAFVLRFVEEMDVLEVAAALDVSESTAKREIASARESVLRGTARDPLLSAYLGAFGRDSI